MSIIRFVHAADLHLDSPFKGLQAGAPPHVAGALTEATFAAYENIVRLCIDERVDALLVAGDVFDSADRSLRAQLRFIDGLRRLDQAGIRSFVCHGNHDPLDGWAARLDYPPGCHRFGPEFESAPVFPEDPARAVVHGVSYPKRDVYENLVKSLPAVDPAPYSIGLIHANVGADTGHAPYAPCSLEDLTQSGINYWALGHVHTRNVLRESAPTVVYPGNPQGRQVNESGARGVYLVDVDDAGRANLEFRPMDVVRWEQIEIDIAGADSEQRVIDELDARARGALEAADGRSVVLRATLAGSGEMHASMNEPDRVNDMREEFNRRSAAASPFAWIERVEVRTSSTFNREERLKGSDFVAELLKTVDAAKQDPELLARISAELDDLYRHSAYRNHVIAVDAASLLDEAEDAATRLLVEGLE